MATASHASTGIVPDEIVGHALAAFFFALDEDLDVARSVPLVSSNASSANRCVMYCALSFEVPRPRM